MGERFEDVIDRIAKNFRYSDFLRFARVRDGLSLDEVDISEIISDYPGEASEQKIQMLQQWREKHPCATTNKLLQIEQNYRNKDEGDMILEDRIHMFHNSRISGYPYIFHGEQDHGEGMKRKLAIKLLWPQDEATREKVQKREAKNLCKLPSHQNVISYVSSGLLKLGKMNFSFIAMELCDTRNLNYYIANLEEPLDMQTKISYGRQVVEGLNHIHSNDMAHRDLKPHNILLSLDGRFIKIADFGTSKTMDASRSTTQHGVVRIGSDGYRAPETYNSGVVTTESDIFSLGLSLHFVWSDGKHPYGLDPDEWNTRIKKFEEPDLKHLTVKPKQETRELIARLLNSEPDKRPTAVGILQEWPYQMQPRSRELSRTEPPSDQEEVEQTPMKQHILMFAKSERCIYAFDPTETSSGNEDDELKKAQDIMDRMVTDTFSSVAIGDEIFVLTWIGYVYKTRPVDKAPSWTKVDDDSFFLHGRYPPAGVLKNCIYICGGGWEEGGYCAIRQLALQKASSDCEVYDVNSGNWKKMCAMKQQRRHNSVVAANGCVYSIGGQDVGGESLKSVEKYYPANDSWVTVAPMKTARHKAAAVEYQGKILVLGGKNDANVSIVDVEQYDIENDEWIKFPSMSMSRSLFCAFICESKLYAIGGDGSGVNRFPAGRSIEVFDEGEWKEIKCIDRIPLEGAASLVMRLPKISRES